MSVNYNEYVCMFDYADGWASYHRGDVVKINNVILNGGSDNPKPWVYVEEGYPIMLEAFKFCFIWKGDWKGEEDSQL